MRLTAGTHAEAIAQGPAPNFQMELLAHTIDVNGEITAKQFEFITRCTG